MIKRDLRNIIVLAFVAITIASIIAPVLVLADIGPDPGGDGTSIVDHSASMSVYYKYSQDMLVYIKIFMWAVDISQYYHEDIIWYQEAYVTWDSGEFHLGDAPSAHWTYSHVTTWTLDLDGHIRRRTSVTWDFRTAAHPAGLSGSSFEIEGKAHFNFSNIISDHIHYMTRTIS